MTAAFWVLAAILVASAVWTISASKPVYSVVALLLNFAALAVLYLTLSAEFLAVIQIIVYSGAILMLFVFVIALLSSGVTAFSAGPNRVPKICGAGRNRRRVGLRLRRLCHSTRAARDAAARRRGRLGRRLRQRRRLRQGAVHRAAASLRGYRTGPDGRRHRRHHVGRGSDARRSLAADERKVERAMREAILREGKG